MSTLSLHHLKNFIQHDALKDWLELYQPIAPITFDVFNAYNNSINICEQLFNHINQPTQSTEKSQSSNTFDNFISGNIPIIRNVYAESNQLTCFIECICSADVLHKMNWNLSSILNNDYIIILPVSNKDVVKSDWLKIKKYVYVLCLQYKLYHEYNITDVKIDAVAVYHPKSSTTKTTAFNINSLQLFEVQYNLEWMQQKFNQSVEWY